MKISTRRPGDVQKEETLLDTTRRQHCAPVSRSTDTNQNLLMSLRADMGQKSRVGGKTERRRSRGTEKILVSRISLIILCMMHLGIQVH